MATEDPTSENLANVLALVRGTLDSEFQRAERWDEKARGLSTLAGSWFAATQAIAAIAVSGASSGWVLGLLFGLVFQAVALVFSLAYTTDVWRPRNRTEFGRETLEALRGRMGEAPADIATALIDFYTPVLDEAQKANEQRGKCYEDASWWWWWVLVTGLMEIAVALLSHVPV